MCAERQRQVDFDLDKFPSGMVPPMVSRESYIAALKRLTDDFHQMGIGKAMLVVNAVVYALAEQADPESLNFLNKRD